VKVFTVNVPVNYTVVGVVKVKVVTVNVRVKVMEEYGTTL
jgi:hypothetical protein